MVDLVEPLFFTESHLSLYLQDAQTKIESRASFATSVFGFWI